MWTPRGHRCVSSVVRFCSPPLIVQASVLPNTYSRYILKSSLPPCIAIGVGQFRRQHPASGRSSAQILFVRASPQKVAVHLTRSPSQALVVVQLPTTYSVILVLVSFHVPILLQMCRPLCNKHHNIERNHMPRPQMFQKFR